MKICRYPECFKPQHRFSLCNKHRKWVERGYMTVDLVMLKKVIEKPGYKDKRCRIDDCPNRPRRNWLCEKHSSAVRDGRMTTTGDKIWKRAAPYSQDFECIKCGARGKITRGFCKRHYAQYLRGAIDFDGQPLREMRIVTYGPDDECKAEGCRRRPRIRGWCENHHKSLRKGVYDASGKRRVPAVAKNKGRACLECDMPAHCKGLCVLHYSRMRTGYLGPGGYKNVGQTCSHEGCSRPAHCRTLCTLHYGREKRALKAQETGAVI